MENHRSSTDFSFNPTDEDDLGISADDNQLNDRDGQLKTMEDDTGSGAH